MSEPDEASTTDPSTTGTPATTSQMAKDVVTFLNWAAEPEHDERKKAGLKAVILFSALTAISLYVKRHKWSIIKTRKIREFQSPSRVFWALLIIFIFRVQPALVALKARVEYRTRLEVVGDVLVHSLDSIGLHIPPTIVDASAMRSVKPVMSSNGPRLVGVVERVQTRGPDKEVTRHKYLIVKQMLPSCQMRLCAQTLRRCLALALELDTVTISSLPTRVVVICGLISYSP